MPETTQKTAMMQLRDRLQAQLRISTNKDYQDCYKQTINLIDTELLEVEKQQRENDYKQGLQDGYACMPTSLT